MECGTASSEYSHHGLPESFGNSRWYRDSAEHACGGRMCGRPGTCRQGEGMQNLSEIRTTSANVGHCGD